MTRREACLLPFPALAAASSPLVILRSGWQTENIGDIAHTPGLLRLLERQLPRARFTLWSNALDRGVEAMLRAHFPKLIFLGGEPGSPAVQQAFEEAAFLLHGSGPSLVARGHVEAWVRQTAKPWGAFGITVTARGEAASPQLDEGLKELLETARFIFTRETASLANLRNAGLQRPKLDFIPDATFALHVRDEDRAARFLRMHSLQPGRFLCVVPRLRYTPYHQMRKVDWSPELIRKRTEVNERHMESDHARFREAIVAWVRRTESKVLLCPEMTYQVGLLRPLLYDPLPPDVRPQVVARPDYWLTDEAASTYARAAAVLSFECHSPIIAAAAGTPGIYVHQPEDGIKGRMWNDVGLGDYYFEAETVTGAQLAARLLDIAAHGSRERKRLRKIVEDIRRRQARALAGLV